MSGLHATALTFDNSPCLIDNICQTGGIWDAIQRRLGNVGHRIAECVVTVSVAPAPFVGTVMLGEQARP